jgi:hypothetical protein
MHNILAVFILTFQLRTGYSDMRSRLYSVSIGHYAALPCCRVRHSVSISDSPHAQQDRGASFSPHQARDLMFGDSLYQWPHAVQHWRPIGMFSLSLTSLSTPSADQED